MLSSGIACSARVGARGWLQMRELQAAPRKGSLVWRASNLGALESLLEAKPQQLSFEEQKSLYAQQQRYLEQQQQQAAALDFGPRVDWGPAAASMLLLLLLLALSSNRILGLEERFVRWVRWAGEQKRYLERNRAIEARQRLERQFGREEGGGGSGSGSGGSGAD